MKRMSLLLALLLVLAAGNVCAHDKGDLMFTPEMQMGVAFPRGIVFPDVSDHSMLNGFDFHLQAIVDYYLASFFSLNAGLGYGFNYHWFMAGSEDFRRRVEVVSSIPVFGWVAVPFMLIAHAYDKEGYYFASYITIPMGFRFSLSVFTIGAGATANIPLYGSIEWGTYSSNSFNSYMGWYIDAGFDLSGGKEKKHGSGALLRVNGPFPSNDAARFNFWGNEQAFNFISLSLVFRFSIELANLPIGGKKE